MEPVWLNKLLHRLEEVSEEEWLTNLYNNSKQDSEQFIKDEEVEENLHLNILIEFFRSNLNDFQEKLNLEFFRYLNLSILSGEIFLKDFSKNIDKCITKCGNLFQYTEFDSNIILENQLKNSLESVIADFDILSALKNFLNEYKSNSQYLKRLVEKPSINTLFDLSDQTKEIFESLQDSIHINLGNLTHNNLALLRSDFSLSYSPNSLENLIIYRNNLKSLEDFFQAIPNSGYLHLLSILIDKSTFLIRKFIIRKSQETESYNENYAFLGEEIELNLESHPLNLKIFSNWDKYSQEHFLSEKNLRFEIKLKSQAKDLLKNKNAPYRSKDLHSLIKYYKDLSPNIEELEKIEPLIKSLDNDSHFDVYSKNIIIQYCLNNILSKKLEVLDINKISKNKLAEILEDRLYEITKFQEQTEIANFFPYFKASDILVQYIENELSKYSVNEDLTENLLDEIKESIGILENCFKKFENNLKWSHLHFNYAYQPSFKDCIVIAELENKEKVNVFCSSTFSLPIDFSKYELFLKETEFKLLRFENQTKWIQDMFQVVSSFNNERDNLKKSVENSTKKNLELLGIFSAIIALLFQGAYTSQSSSSFESKLFTFSVMFIVLCSFLLMLREVSYRKNNDEKLKYSDLSISNIILCFVIPILIVLILLIYKI